MALDRLPVYNKVRMLFLQLEASTKKLPININARLGYLSHFDAKKIIARAFDQAPAILSHYDFTKNYGKAIIKKSI